MIKFFESLLRTTRIATSLVIVMAVLTGVIYPGVVTVIAQSAFHWQANGSLMVLNDHFIGSKLIGQSFDSPAYFWGRPSATANYPYNALASGGSNYSVMNEIFLSDVRARIQQLQRTTDQQVLVPVDLVTSSGSGLDPEISPYAAFYQVSRVAASRQLPPEDVIALIHAELTARTFRILGEPTINVLTLNLALDKLRSAHGRASS